MSENEINRTMPSLYPLGDASLIESILFTSNFTFDPGTKELPQSTLVFPTYIRVVSTVFCVLVLVVGVLGNLLVPAVLLRNKDMRNSTNFFLLNLSLADLLVLVVCLPTAFVELYSPPDVWLLGQGMCELNSLTQ